MWTSVQGIRLASGKAIRPEGRRTPLCAVRSPSETPGRPCELFIVRGVTPFARELASK
jgi:hypothetical protein